MFWGDMVSPVHIADIVTAQALTNTGSRRIDRLFTVSSSDWTAGRRTRRVIGDGPAPGARRQAKLGSRNPSPRPPPRSGEEEAEEHPSPRPTPRSGEGEKHPAPLSAAGSGPGGRVNGQTRP